MYSDYHPFEHAFSACFYQLCQCQFDQTHNPTLSQTVLSQSHHVPAIVGRRANGGFHARVSAGRKQFARHEWAQKAAYLLGCTLEELSSSIFKHQAKGTLPRASTIRQASDENGTADAGTPRHIYHHTLYSSQYPPFSLPFLFCHSHSIYTCTRICYCSSLKGKMQGREKVKLILVMNTTALQWLLTDRCTYYVGKSNFGSTLHSLSLKS